MAGRLGRTPERAAETVVAPRGVASPVTCQATLPPADVEMLKRELLAAVTEASPPPEPPPPARDPAAGQAALAVIDRAQAAVSWTDDDRMALRRTLAEAGPEARREAMIRLTTAINQQRLQLLTTTPGLL